MAITEEQAKIIKEELLKQLSHFPEERQKQIREQVEAMTTEQLESFVKQNQLSHLENPCIFCSIISNKAPSVKLAENKENLAVLEINPLSKGHTLIIPKEHVSEIKNSTHELAEGISDLLAKKLEPKKIEKNEIDMSGHKVLEVIPIYGDEKERKPAKKETLLEIKSELLKQEETPKPKEKENPKEEIKESILPKIKPRIP